MRIKLGHACGICASDAGEISVASDISFVIGGEGTDEVGVIAVDARDLFSGLGGEVKTAEILERA